MIRAFIICLFSLSLLACTTPSPLVMSELQQGKRYFDDGYYKKALHELWPLAADGRAEAQYAIGYMYYYGLGVAQDTETGYFWIRRAADKGYPPAIKALGMISNQENYQTRSELKYKGV